MQVQALAVEIATGIADFEELLDFRVMNVEINGGRSAPQRALADGERQSVHDVDEGDNAGGLAVSFDDFAY